MNRMKLKGRYRLKVSLLCFMAFMLGQFSFYRFRLANSNEEFLASILENSNYYMRYENQNLFERFMSQLCNVDLNSPISMLSNFFQSDIKEEPRTFALNFKNPVVESENPLVYIYNSHQKENYELNNYEPYNITPNVMMASYMLKEKLASYGINAYVEENDFSAFLNLNNWDYNYSYTASRYYMDGAKTKYPSLVYFIDIHRDAINYNQSVVTVNDKKMAKLLFVVGGEHANYKENINLANRLNAKIKASTSGLSRGVILKQGNNVNGIYNQDISPKALLIEVGGYQNKIDEVMNTIEVISTHLKEIIDEDQKS